MMSDLLPANIVWQRDTFTNDLGLHLRVTGFVNGKEFCFVWKPESWYVTAWAKGLNQSVPTMGIVHIDLLGRWFRYHL